MPVGSRRSELEIIRDILRTGSGRITSLRHNVNMGHSQMQKYLSFLEGSGLIQLERTQRRVNFEVTEKGRRVQELIEQILELMRVDNSNGIARSVQ
jgi:predicted transcriptional regulator